MEIRFHALALLRYRVDLVATPVDLDAPDLPAAIGQHLLELFLGLPLFLRPRVAGGESRGVRRRGGESGESARRGKKAQCVCPLSFGGVLPRRRVNCCVISFSVWL